MAGESPGKSEQRKSSGETAESERDPRLAVFRERAREAADPAAEPEPERNSAPGAADEGEGAADEGAADEGAGAGADSGAASDDAPKAEDSRLRAAVAAWVATTEEPAEPSAEPVGDAGGDIGAGAATGVRAAGTGAVTGTGAAADTESRAEAELDAEAADDEVVDGEVVDGEVADDESVSGEGSVAGGDAGRGEDAVHVDDPASAGTDAADVAAADVDAGGSGAGGSAAAGSGATGSAVTVAAVSGSAATGSDAAASDATDAEAADEAITTGAATGTDAKPHTHDTPEAVAKPDADIKPDADGKLDADAKPHTHVTPEADAEPDADAKFDVNAKPDADADADAKAAAVGAGTDESGENDAAPVADDGDTEAEADADPDDGKGVDQATAVFRTTPRPARQTDQPTAMLKLPPTEPKGGSRSGQDVKGRQGPRTDRPESDAERTSTFVPLKPDGARPVGPPRTPGQGAGRPGSRPGQSGRAGGPAWAAGPQPAPAAAATSALPEAELTKQQPVPPKPPLDLLAELTNKPAPPETPVRTTVRRFKIWTPLVLLLLVIFAVVQFVRPLPEAKLALSATPTFTFDGGRTEMPWPGEGQSAIEVDGVGSMGTEGPQKPAPIASMAKVMTAYVILKDHPITGKENGPRIKVDQQGEDDGNKGDESTAKIKAGQEYTQRQMLQMLMIPSGNNVARLLGRWDAGSEDKFLEKMNTAAKDLGMTNTKYTDSSGFDKGTVSTPVDQIRLGRAVMKNDIFRKIVDMPDVEVPGLPERIYNNNKILLKPGVNGIKTGSTTPAGGNLLFTASTIVDGKERRIIGAVMNQTTGTVLNDRLDKAIFDSLKLIEKAQAAVTSATVVKKGDVVGYVDDGLGGRTPVVATKDLKAVGWPGLKVDLAIGGAPGKPVPHTGKAGDVVGEVTAGAGPGKVSAPVALQSPLAEPGFGAKLTRVG
ncbi:serine hydrolase [Streptomyces sp. NPDC091272]|uniref:D-alanyl-D-alanine carboxypeptidase family protein n=1 Tax=Streptomyces sp. NPDC091272 TaxID=3365981 RepID=UPI00381EEFFE